MFDLTGKTALVTGASGGIGGAIAAALHALAGDAARAAVWAQNVRERNGVLRREDFFRSFPMKSAVTRTRVSQSLERLGF